VVGRLFQKKIFGRKLFPFARPRAQGFHGPVEANRSVLATPEALADLLDDPSLAVRHALLEYFGRQPAEAAGFLGSIARGDNRVLRQHAQWFLRELKLADPVAEFRAFIQSQNYELETGALLLSRTVNPALDAGACCRLLDQMAVRVRELVTEPATAAEKCQVLNRVIFHEYGFRGDSEHYTDPRNSLFDQVLDRRRGLPLTLSVVYLLVAARIGLELHPIGVPGHFFVGCFEDRAPFFIDAFRRGSPTGPLELLHWLRRHGTPIDLSDLAPTPVREVLARCCRNLAHHYAAAGEEDHARLFHSFVREFETTYARHA